MEPGNVRFGGGALETALHPLVAIAMGVLIVLILVVPRKHVTVPFLLGAFFIPLGQVVVVVGMHFSVLRILILVGCARLISSKLSSRTSTFAGGFNSTDRVFTGWAFLYALSFSLQWMETQAFINRLGFLMDALGGYLLLRFLIQDKEDARRVIRLFALIAVVMAICMINEQLTRRNIFGLLGGVSSVPELRHGRVRSQGIFQHSLLAGTFGAILLPLFVLLWEDRKFRIAAIAGMISSLAIVLTSAASTSVLAYATAIMGLCFWPLRQQMRVIRWGIVAALLGLHLFMKAPVWALIARVDLTGASSSDHRFALVDNFIRHFGDWWLLGAKDYNNWGWDMWDLSNQYVNYGLRGGLATLAFFIAIISTSFGRLGDARKLVAGDRYQEWFLWCLGTALFTHVVAYFGISYFDQIQIAWYALLAIISAAVSETTRSPDPQVQRGLESTYQTEAAMRWEMLEANR